MTESDRFTSHINEMVRRLDYLRGLVAEIRASGYRRPEPDIKRWFPRSHLWRTARKLSTLIEEGEGILQNLLLSDGLSE